MLITARVKHLVSLVREKKIVGIALLMCLVIFGFVAPLPLYAQVTTTNTVNTETNTSQPQIDPLQIFAMFTPNTESNVPLNQHTLFQSLFIEATSTMVCVLSGVDIMNPQQGCLGINPQTHKIGYSPAPKDPNGTHVGGLVGVMAYSIGGLYTPATSTSEYFHYLASNFGIVKPVYAQTATQGAFLGLTPILDIWRAVRNIAYLLLVLAFIFIGVGIMLRVRIDPRTVMTIQNQIPRVVIAIIVITFSYAIAAFLGDLMWVTTYVGINAITATAGTNPNNVPQCNLVVQTNVNLSQEATSDLLQNPIYYVNDIFAGNCAPIVGSGLAQLTNNVSGAIGGLLSQLIKGMFGLQAQGAQCFPNFNVGACMVDLITWLAGIIINIVVFLVILISLFRVWIELLKAFIIFLVYVVAGPIWIVFGLLPGRPLGIEKWLRGLLANLLPFPLVAFLFVGARVIDELFKNANALSNTNPTFMPPMLGNPLTPNFGSIVALGAILLAPTILKQMRDAMKVQGNKYAGAALAGGFAAGAGVAGAVPNRVWQGVNRRNPNTGAAMGIVAHGIDRAKFGFLSKVAGPKGMEEGSKGWRGFAGRAAGRLEGRATQGGSTYGSLKGKGAQEKEGAQREEAARKAKEEEERQERIKRITDK